MSNPAPWSEARPRILCESRHLRAVLTAQGVRCEEDTQDAMGQRGWAPASDVCSNLNLYADAALARWAEGVNIAGKAIFLRSETEAAGLHNGPHGLSAGRSAQYVCRRADACEDVVPIPDAWYVLDGQDAEDTKVALMMRWIGGDPSVLIEVFPA